MKPEDQVEPEIKSSNYYKNFLAHIRAYGWTILEMEAKIHYHDSISVITVKAKLQYQQQIKTFCSSITPSLSLTMLKPRPECVYR
ncbi:hypothetical protein KC644_01885 [Candidatus Berkelbacteria bacterium]|nr:hypothetical protein [Candidatus Berkelbacteria bacterium]